MKETQKPRAYKIAKTGDKELGALKLLPGEWKAEGTGWNMIALPFDDGRFNFRVLMNQYNETLKFTDVDDNVPNRGLDRVINEARMSYDKDQFVVTLDYQQVIDQIAVEDSPKTDLIGELNATIHHEPGLWLYMKNLRTRDTDTPDVVKEIDIARLATIPHGNSVLALGTSDVVDGLAPIPDISGMPIGVPADLQNPYLSPYKHFIDHPFKGTACGVPNFPGFEPLNMNAILQFANKGLEVERTTILSVDTSVETAGIINAPFATKQAEPVSMKSTFWIQELKQKDQNNHPLLRLQYSQVVMLDFFRPRRDELPGRIKWPHISIATLNKVIDSSEYA